MVPQVSRYKDINSLPYCIVHGISTGSATDGYAADRLGRFPKDMYPGQIPHFPDVGRELRKRPMNRKLAVRAKPPGPVETL